MQLNITGHHLDVTDSLHEYVTSKIGRLERHIDVVTNAHVVLAVEKQRQKAEATVQVAGNSLFAQAEHDDLYAAIDALIDKLDRQVIRHAEKRRDHRRQ